MACVGQLGKKHGRFTLEVTLLRLENFVCGMGCCGNNLLGDRAD